MKKLLFLIFIMCALKANSQLSSKTELSKLNKDQLELALETTSGKMWVGKIMIGIGTVLIIPGGVMVSGGRNKNDFGPSPETVTGLYLLGGGLLFELVGIPTYITSSNRKTKIEIELAKFNLKGSASINGIGLKIRF